MDQDPRDSERTSDNPLMDAMYTSEGMHSRPTKLVEKEETCESMASSSLELYRRDSLIELPQNDDVSISLRHGDTAIRDLAEPLLLREPCRMGEQHSHGPVLSFCILVLNTIPSVAFSYRRALTAMTVTDQTYRLRSFELKMRQHVRRDIRPELWIILQISHRHNRRHWIGSFMEPDAPSHHRPSQN